MEKLENDNAIRHNFDDMYFNGAERSHGLSLDIGSRYERAEHKTVTLFTNLKIWISSAHHFSFAGSGLGPLGGQRQKFSVTSVGVIFNQWGVKPHQPPIRQI